MRRQHSFAGVLESEPLAHVFEAAADSQRGRGQNRAFQFVEQASLAGSAPHRWAWPEEKHSACRVRRARRSIQKTVLRSSDSIRKPSCTCSSWARRAKLKTSSGFDGRFSSSDPRRVSACCSPRNSSPFSSRNSRRFSKAKRPSPVRQQGKEEQRPLAQALQRARQRSRQHVVALQRDFDIAAKLLEARVADRDPEVASGNIFQFVASSKITAPTSGRIPASGAYSACCLMERSAKNR